MPVVMKKDFSIFWLNIWKTSNVKMSRCVMFCFKYARFFSGLVRFGFSELVSHHWIKCFIFKIISKASSVGVLSNLTLFCSKMLWFLFVCPMNQKIVAVGVLHYLEILKCCLFFNESNPLSLHVNVTKSAEQHQSIELLLLKKLHRGPLKKFCFPKVNFHCC